MEVKYSDLMTWSPHKAPPSDASGQWGHNIKVVGLPRRESGTKKKSLLADMFGFTLDGELSNVANYLRSHGSFKLEQVRTKATCVQYFTIKRPVDFCLVMVACYTFMVDCSVFYGQVTGRFLSCYGRLLYF